MNKLFCEFELLPEDLEVTPTTRIVLRLAGSSAITDPEAIAFIQKIVPDLGLTVKDNQLAMPDGTLVIHGDAARTVMTAINKNWHTLDPLQDLKLLLFYAVRDRHIVRFRYHDEDRVVEPHTLGEDKLAGWQVDKGWRLFKLDEITGCNSRQNEIFLDPRPGYKKGDSRMKSGIIAEL